MTCNVLTLTHSLTHSLSVLFHWCSRWKEWNFASCLTVKTHPDLHGLPVQYLGYWLLRCSRCCTSSLSVGISPHNQAARAVVPGGLMFYCWCSFFQREISKLPRPIAEKLCHVIGSVYYFVIQVPKFVAFSPKNGAKTGKIRHSFGQLQTWIANISGTDGDIRNPKTMWSSAISSAFSENKSGELWSLTTKTSQRG